MIIFFLNYNTGLLKHNAKIIRNVNETVLNNIKSENESTISVTNNIQETSELNTDGNYDIPINVFKES